MKKIYKIYYLTSSIIPSINANTINVISMCSALSLYSKNLNFFFSTNKGVDKKYIKENFNISLYDNVSLNFINTKKFHELLIFLYSLKFFISDMIFKKEPNIIICRNIYGGLFYSFFFKYVIYETHTVEKLFFRKIIQSLALKKKNIITISITESLKQKLICNFNLSKYNIKVLPDASFDNSKKFIYRNPRIDRSFKIGYFGHLYKGRGIELIINLAKRLVNFKFFVVGGDKKSFFYFKRKNLPHNLKLTGHQNFKKSKEIMREMDILLCPYQKKVYLKDQKTSTSSIMSPLKIFEYMSSQKVIISSNLPVLREVLNNNVNCFLVNPKNTQDWANLILKISKNNYLKKSISMKAYLSFKSKYSWDIRVKNLFKFLDEKKN